MVAALLYGSSPALAQLLGDAEGFGLLAGSAVTCTDSTVTGDVGVDVPTGGITQTSCTVTGTVFPAGDPAAQAAYDDFLDAYTTLNSTTCDETLTGTLAGVTLTPGVYCVDAVAKTGTLTLDAEGDANAQFIFLVDGALTGTNFNVEVINGGDLCNVYWQTDGATTLTTSDVVGTVLSGAAITVTGGSFEGGLLATDAATLTTSSVVDACGETSGVECGNGILEAPEECDDGNTENGDGCSALCLIEEASDCSAFPCGRNANKVEVCHIPPGNPRNARTICISPNAVDTHIQRHGDSCGPCEP
jgi:cysteine-rich repeat protein